MTDQTFSLTYIIGTFPGLTTTFIDREIETLRRMGIPLQILAIRNPTTPISAYQKELQKGVIYLLPVRWPAFLSGNLRFALGKSGRYFGTLFYLLTRPHPTLRARVMTLLHFGEGVYAAHLLRANPVSHLHAHFIDRAATVALVAGRLLDLPYSVTAHASDIYVHPILLKEKLAGAKFVATCTRYNREYLSQFGSNLYNHKLFCIYHGLDSRRYSRTRPTPDGKPVILSVGQLKERKGLRYLVDACKLLRDRKVDFECRIIGDGPLRSELEAQIRQMDLTNLVILYGALPQEEVIQHYEQATIFTLPAVKGADGDRDGIPNVILEALAMEVPVVSTDHSGVPEVVEDGVNGLLVPPTDSEALANALETLLNNPEMRLRFGRSGRQMVLERFHPDKNIQKLLDAFLQEDQPKDAPANHPLFLVWDNPNHGSSRSRVLAKELGASGPYYISVLKKRGALAAPLRYLIQAAQTLHLLFKKRPSMILVQSPPSFAVLVTVLYCLLIGGRYIIDAHTDALTRNIWTRPRWLYQEIARRATLTLVTDEYFRQQIESWGAKAMVLRDPVTSYPLEPYSLNGQFNVTLVNSFGGDEPVEEFLQAAVMLPEVQFQVTGKLNENRESLVKKAPPNVHFTNFLPEKQYYGLLRASHVVMSLSTRDHTLQCGACESLSLSRPIITSDWPLLREYFCKGTVHVNNKADGIRQGIEEIRQNYERYQEEIIQLRRQRYQEWQQLIAVLSTLIHGKTRVPGSTVLDPGGDHNEGGNEESI